MRTEAQIAGNSAKSRGPVTTIGPAISAQDSTTDATRGCCSTETSPFDTEIAKQREARTRATGLRVSASSRGPRPRPEH
jgi:hypothetical protein